MVAAAWVLSISGKLTQNITVNPFWKHGMFLCQQLEKAKILISHLTSEVVHCVSCPYLSVCIFCSFFSFLFLPSDDINLSQRCCLLGVFSTKWFLYSSVDARSMWTQVEMLCSLFILVCDFAQTYHLCSRLGCDICHEQRAEPAQSRTWERLFSCPCLNSSPPAALWGETELIFGFSCWKNSSVTTDSICNISKESVPFLNVLSWWATWSICSGKFGGFKALPTSVSSQKSQWGRSSRKIISIEDSDAFVPVSEFPFPGMRFYTSKNLLSFWISYRCMHASSWSHKKTPKITWSELQLQGFTW